MQKNYELLYIVHPDLEGSTDKVTDKVVASITKAEGTITSQEDWGKRKLAYQIAKNDFGVYVLINFTVDSESLHLIERDIRLSEEILRSMIVAIPDIKEIILKPRKEKAAETEAKVEEPASIIVAEDKPVAAVKKVAKVAKKADAEEEKSTTEKKPVAKKAAVKKPAKPTAAEEKERLKKLDEKLEELLK